MGRQGVLFDKGRADARRYSNVLTITRNRKGVIDVDTVKGCTRGMLAYPDGGCYGECYAARTAARYRIIFNESVSRQFYGREHRDALIKQLLALPGTWYRIGTAGDPCHDWRHTIAVLRSLRWSNKRPVIITKHWVGLTDKQLDDLRWLKAVVNTSISALDTDSERAWRLEQHERVRKAGINGVLRVVTCAFGATEWGQWRSAIQRSLLAVWPIIDNPLRVGPSNTRVASGDILVTKRPDSIGGGKSVSLHCDSVYLGECNGCPDQCGADGQTTNFKEPCKQLSLATTSNSSTSLA